MRNLKLYLLPIGAIVLLLWCLLFVSQSFAAGTSSTSQPEATITIPLTQWNELKSNNEKALSLIETSSAPLTEVQSLVMKQREELNEAHNTISTLETELMKAKMLSMKQEVTLSEMSSSLIELKGQIDNDKRTIKRLRMQRNLSQMVGAGAVIGVVIHR